MNLGKDAPLPMGERDIGHCNVRPKKHEKSKNVTKKGKTGK
jgi:hypothetical protein